MESTSIWFQWNIIAAVQTPIVKQNKLIAFWGLKNIVFTQNSHNFNKILNKSKVAKIA